MLEKDHTDLGILRDAMALKAKTRHQACKFGRKQAVEEAGAVLPVSQAIVAVPKHHLSDERDHAMPIILHHCLRG